MNEVNISVKDLAMLCGISLVSRASDQEPVEEFKTLGESVSAEQCSVPPCLPLPPTFALPPVHWVPHPSFYDATDRVPLLVPVKEHVSNVSKVEKPVEADSVVSPEELVQTQEIRSCLGRCSNTQSRSLRSLSEVPATQVSDLVSLAELVQAQRIRSCHRRSSTTDRTLPMSVASDSDEAATKGSQCANDEDSWMESSHIIEHSDWEGALTKPPLKCSRIDANELISWRRASSPQVCCSNEYGGIERKSWKQRKTPSLPNTRIDDFREKTSFARRIDPKTQTCERGFQAIRARPKHHISGVGQFAYEAIDRTAASGWHQ